MDDRTTQIREGAGLDESKLNQEFIDFIRKWSSPALFVVAGIVLLFAGKGYLDKRANAKVNRAFAEVASAVDYTVDSPSPVTLRAIREQYGDIRGIAPMAALREADVYLSAAVRGVAPGAELALGADNQPTGFYAPEDLLSAEDRAKMLDDAERLYREVAGMTREGGAWAIHRLGAQFGLAAVAESKGDAAGAKAAYEAAKRLAEESGFGMWAEVASERMASAERMTSAVELVSKEALPKPPEPVVEPAGPVGPEIPGAAEGEAPAAEPAAEQPAEDVPAEDPGAGDPGSGESPVPPEGAAPPTGG